MEFVTGNSIRSSAAMTRMARSILAAMISTYALNPDGTERWQLATGGAVESGPAIRFDGVVYFGGGPGTNPANGDCLYALMETSPLATTSLADC